MNVVCKTSRRMMSSKLDGQLSWWEGAFLESHLFICPYCRRVNASLSETVSVLHGLDDAPAASPSDPKHD